MDDKTPVPYSAKSGLTRSPFGRDWRSVRLAYGEFDDLKKAIFLKTLAETGLEYAAREAAEVCVKTIKRHMENDDAFAAAYEDAKVSWRDTVIAHHRKLVLNGQIEQRYDKDGNMVSEKQTFPLQLIAMELKRVEPEYRDRQTVDVNANQGGVLVAPPDATPEEWVAAQEGANAEHGDPRLMKDVTPPETETKTENGNENGNGSSE